MVTAAQAYWINRKRRQKRNAASEGVGGPQIVLSASSQVENTSIGTTIGNLSVVGGTGTWTFTKTVDPSSAFTLAIAALKNAIVFNYDAVSSYSVTIQATNGTLTISRTFTITVTNVLEVTLGALTIDDDEAVAGEAWSATITGKTSGSTITATSSDGTVLSVVGTTVSGTFATAGSPNITLHETHPDAAPRDSVIAVTAEAAPVGTPYRIIVCYGQSNERFLVVGNSGSGPSPTANTYVFNADDEVWEAPTGYGAMAMLDELASLYPGESIGIVWVAPSGVDANDLKPDAGEGEFDYFGQLEAALIASGATTVPAGRIILNVHQGENAANVTTADPEDFQSDWIDDIHPAICAVLGKTTAQVPMVMSSLGPTEWGAPANDESWWAIDGAIATIHDASEYAWYSHSNKDADLSDGIHWLNYEKSGRRYARTNYKLWSGSGAIPAAFAIVAVEAVSATQTRFILEHGLGSDISPSSGITGFDASEDGTTWVAGTGVRVNATTVLVTHASLAYPLAYPDDRFGRHQYGLLPDVSGQLFDNSSLAVPLNHSAGQLLVDYALPVMTSGTTPTVAEGDTYVLTLTASRPCTFTLGGADAALFEVVINGADRELHFDTASVVGDYDLTVTPVAIDNGDTGSAQSVGVTVEAAGGTFAKTYVGVIQNNADGWNYLRQSVDIGAAAGKSGIAWVTYSTTADAPPTVKIGVDEGVLIATTEVNSVTYLAAFWFDEMTVNGSQLWDCTFPNSSYRTITMAFWVIEGAGSVTGAIPAGGSDIDPISVAAGEFLFVARAGGLDTFNDSPTAAPDAVVNSSVSVVNLSVGEWTIAATTASFEVGADTLGSTFSSAVRIAP